MIVSSEGVDIFQLRGSVEAEDVICVTEDLSGDDAGFHERDSRLALFGLHREADSAKH